MRPLAGVRVLDMTRLIPGPLGSMVLADLGATVVKVEATTGDPMRWAACTTIAVTAGLMP